MDANGGLIHEKNKPSPSANFNTPWIGAVYLTGPFSAARGGGRSSQHSFRNSKEAVSGPGACESSQHNLDYDYLGVSENGVCLHLSPFWSGKSGLTRWFRFTRFYKYLDSQTNPSMSTNYDLLKMIDSWTRLGNAGVMSSGILSTSSPHQNPDEWKTMNPNMRNTSDDLVWQSLESQLLKDSRSFGCQICQDSPEPWSHECDTRSPKHPHSYLHTLLGNIAVPEAVDCFDNRGLVSHPAPQQAKHQPARGR